MNRPDVDQLNLFYPPHEDEGGANCSPDLIEPYPVGDYAEDGFEEPRPGASEEDIEKLIDAYAECNGCSYFEARLRYRKFLDPDEFITEDDVVDSGRIEEKIVGPSINLGVRDLHILRALKKYCEASKRDGAISAVVSNNPGVKGRLDGSSVEGLATNYSSFNIEGDEEVRKATESYDDLTKPELEFSRSEIGFDAKKAAENIKKLYIGPDKATAREKYRRVLRKFNSRDDL